MKPMQLNPLAVSTLALLAERPMHPYEAYQLMLQRQEDRVVRVSAGSLYRTVERLAEQGLLAEQGSEREGNRPERTVYAITDAGRAALRERLAEMLRTIENEYPEFPVAIGEAHNLPAEEVTALLAERAAELRRRIAFIDGVVPHIQAKGVARRYILNVFYSRAMLEREADWLERTIAELDSGELEWSSADEREHGKAFTIADLGIDRVAAADSD